MRIALITFLLLACKITFGQNVYPLHPSVGDTIDRDEKLDYSLFSKSPNDGFNFATISYINSGFVVIENRSRKQPNGLIRQYHDTIPLAQEQIIEEQQKIQKVNAYYLYLAKEAEKPKVEEQPKIDQKIPIRFEGPISKRMEKESRMKARLIEDQRRMQDFQMGLRPREMMIQIR